MHSSVTNTSHPERRRFPRRPAGGELAAVPVTLQVQIVEISAAGVLFDSPRPLDVGARGSLRLNLAGTPFEAEIQVQRVTRQPDASAAYRIGATFVAVSPEHLRVIEHVMLQ